MLHLTCRKTSHTEDLSILRDEVPGSWGYLCPWQ